MTSTNANSWDASKLLKELTPEEQERLKLKLQESKAVYHLMGRSYNTKLLKFVERKLNNA